VIRLDIFGPWCGFENSRPALTFLNRSNYILLPKLDPIESARLLNRANVSNEAAGNLEASAANTRPLHTDNIIVSAVLGS